MRQVIGIGTIACAVALSACANLNEGASDLRYAEQNMSDGNAAKTSWAVHRKPMDSSVRVEPDDVVSIQLDVGYIKQFHERAITPRGLIEDPKRERGEIAVLVSARPVTTANDAAADPQKNPWVDFSGHRVIFYSNDVHADQRLNGRNLAVFGPAPVPSGRLALDFVIMELDGTSPQMEQLMKKLAELGSASIAPANPQLATLTQLGTTLLASTHDDRELRYTVNFDLRANDWDPNTLPLATGRYVLVRSEDRKTDFNWKGVCMDWDTGKLHNTSKLPDKPTAKTEAKQTTPKQAETTQAEPKQTELKCSEYDAFRDETYLSFTVTTGLSPAANEAGVTLAELQAAIDREQDSTVGVLTKTASELIVANYSRQAAGNARSSWQSVLRAAQAYAAAVRPACAPANPNSPEALSARQQLWQAALSFHDYLAPRANWAAAGPAKLPEEPVAANATDKPVTATPTDNRIAAEAMEADAYRDVADRVLNYLRPDIDAVAASRDPAKFSVAPSVFVSGKDFAKAVTARALTHADELCPATATAATPPPVL